MDNQHAESVPSYCQVLRFKDSSGQVKEMIFPKALDLDRPKRPRTTFSESQLSSLENEFQRNPYLIGKDRTRLAIDLGLTETQALAHSLSSLVIVSVLPDLPSTRAPLSPTISKGRWLDDDGGHPVAGMAQLSAIGRRGMRALATPSFSNPGGRKVKVWFQNRRTKSKRSKAATDQSSSPSSPSSNCDHQNACEDCSKKLENAPAIDNPQIEAPGSKNFSAFNVEQMTNAGSRASAYSKGVVSSFAPCPPTQPLSVASIEFPPFAQAVPSFPECLPIQRQPQVAAPAPQYFGQMAAGQGQNVSWTGPALWFPWPNHLAPCLQQMKPSASSK